MQQSVPFFSTAEALPNDNEYVLIHLTIGNWRDSDDVEGKRYWRVAKFIRGISQDHREKMKSGEMPDPISIGFICPTPPGLVSEHKTKRSAVYTAADEDGNNRVPYRWEEFGSDSYFGQEVDMWARLPNASALNTGMKNES